MKLESVGDGQDSPLLTPCRAPPTPLSQLPNSEQLGCGNMTDREEKVSGVSFKLSIMHWPSWKICFLLLWGKRNHFHYGFQFCSTNRQVKKTEIHHNCCELKQDQNITCKIYQYCCRFALFFLTENHTIFTSKRTKYFRKNILSQSISAYLWMSLTWDIFCLTIVLPSVKEIDHVVYICIICIIYKHMYLILDS